MRPARTLGKPLWKIEVKTGDVFPLPEYNELKGYGPTKRFRYLTKAEAEAAIAKLRRYQPDLCVRVAPI